MRVLEAAAAEIRHRVGLAPDDVVEDPEAEILHRRADAEDVVVGADHPDRAVRLQHAARGEQPGAGEGVVGGEARELVPVVVDRIDLRLVGTVQVAVELQIVGRVGEDQVDGFFRQPVQRRDAIALQDRVEPFGCCGERRKSSRERTADMLDTRNTRYCLLPVMVTVSRKYLMKRGHGICRRGGDGVCRAAIACRRSSRNFPDCHDPARSCHFRLRRRARRFAKIIAARVEAELSDQAGYEISAEEIVGDLCRADLQGHHAAGSRRSRGIPFQASLIDQAEELVDRRLQAEVRAIEGAHEAVAVGHGASAASAPTRAPSGIDFMLTKTGCSRCSTAASSRRWKRRAASRSRRRTSSSMPRRR